MRGPGWPSPSGAAGFALPLQKLLSSPHNPAGEFGLLTSGLAELPAKMWMAARAFTNPMGPPALEAYGWTLPWLPSQKESGSCVLARVTKQPYSGGELGRVIPT